MRFSVGDALALDEPDRSLDAVRSERTLGAAASRCPSRCSRSLLWPRRLGPAPIGDRRRHRTPGDCDERVAASLLHQSGGMSVTVPSGLRHAVVDDDGGQEWLDSLPARAGRAVERWDLVLAEPFETGMAGWTAPGTTAAGADVVLKLSFPHPEARDEAAALEAWRGAGAVEVLGADADDWALLLRRLQPGSTLRDEGLPPAAHLAVGAAVLRRMATVPVPAGEPFQDLVDVADRLAVIAAGRVERLAPAAPIPVDAGLCRHAVDLLRTLPGDATRLGLAHGDPNPGNILRHDDAAAGGEDASAGWLAIDPKPVHGDLAWDPWPLLTQVGDWTTAVSSADVLADRTRLVAEVAGLDAARVAAWCVARGSRRGSGPPTVAGGPASGAPTATWPERAPGRARRPCSAAERPCRCPRCSASCRTDLPDPGAAVRARPGAPAQAGSAA